MPLSAGWKVRLGCISVIELGYEARRMYAQPVEALSSEHLARWHDLHDAGGGSSSPFLHPTYARIAAEVRGDVEVGVVTSGDDVIGFVPFQRSILDVGGPVGSRLCDMAGAVAAPLAPWDPQALARAAGLKTLRLPNVPTSTNAFAPFQKERSEAPLLDLSNGFDAYRRASLDSGSSFMKQLERKARKLEREVGPWRFVWHTEDDEVFDKLLAWKDAQRRATRTPNVLRLPWAQALVRLLRRESGERFGGVLSALYVGDTLAAAHFGLRTKNVMHYWIPAYNADLGAYSPGLLALVELARASAQRGIERIDLGSGEERYKRRAATGALSMGVATINTSAAFQAFSDSMDQLRAWSRASRLGEVVRATGRSVMRGSYLLRSMLT